MKKLKDNGGIRKLVEFADAKPNSIFILFGFDSCCFGPVRERLSAVGHEVVILPDGEDAKDSVEKILARAGNRELIIGYTEEDYGAMRGMFYNLKVIYSNPDDQNELKLAHYKPERPVRQARRIEYGEPNAPAPMFSILIPVRNNAKCLRHCLRTIVEQTCKDFEVIVSDNSDNQHTGVFKLVEELKYRNLVYVRPDRNLNLEDSFEFAHQHSRGEYILSLGADDGLLLHGIAALKAIVEQQGHKLDTLVFDYMFYGWGDAAAEKFRQYVKLPPSIAKGKTLPEIKTCNALELLEKYAAFEIPFYPIPNGYMYSMVSRRAFDLVKGKIGRLFPDYAQDTCMGGNLCTVLKEVSSIALPISIVGTSAKSVGSFGRDSLKIQHSSDIDAKKMKRVINCSLHKSYDGLLDEICGFSADEITAVACILRCVEKKLLPAEWIDKINWKRYFELCVSYVYEDDENFRIKLDDIKAKIALRGRPELERWFGDSYYDNPDFHGFPAPSSAPFTFGMLPNGALYLNGSDFELSNVYDAAVLFEKIANFKSSITYPPAG